jgi:hypothetical protein
MAATCLRSIGIGDPRPKRAKPVAPFEAFELLRLVAAK